MRTALAFSLAAVVLVASARGGRAQVERFDLETMLGRCDNAVVGEIVGSESFRVDDPSDPGGEPLYFTTLHLVGRSICDGRVRSVSVVHPGGFTHDGDGVWNSEAPSEDDVRVGTRVVAFYRWVDDLGGGFGGNALIAAHGGIFRTSSGPHGDVVLGRGEGYAVRQNLSVDDLHVAVSALRR